jgi:hypothetical protein
MRIAMRWIAVALLPLLGGCTTFLDIIDRTEELGALEYHGDPAVVNVPAEGEAGRPFEVTVRTYGDGCTEKGRTEVEVAGGRAIVRPYDYHRQRVDCPSILGLFDHTAMVQFEVPGTFEVVIEGRSVPSYEVIRVTRTVHVR